MLIKDLRIDLEGFSMTEKGKLKVMTKGYKAGRDMADAIISFIHLMYQKQTANRVLFSLTSRLKDREKEFK